MFTRCYNSIKLLAAHRAAPYFLFGLSFIESSFFIIPPDVLLIPMVLATPKFAWRYAALTTVGSVLGGILGYFIGMFFFDSIGIPFLEKLHYLYLYEQVINWYNVWGAYSILIAGFSPIPYKLFTIASGALHFSLPIFILFSLLGRGARFFLVAYLSKKGQVFVDNYLEQYIERIGWISVILLSLCGFLYYFYH